MRRLVLFLTIVMAAVACHAQQTIRGEVSDSATNERLAAVSITLLRGGKPVKFVRTDAKGTFTMSTEVKEGDQLSVVFLGYRKQVMPVVVGKNMQIRMVPTAFELKEVVVKSGPVFGKADTITYDLTRFASERDNSLKDVLRKLPGIEIEKSGRINYQGQAIKRFTVEGLDLTGGRYNKMTETLKAKDVDKAEIIEHDQPIKALQNKVLTNDVGMNIKLKPEARDKWMFTLTPHAGLTNHEEGSFWDDVLIGGKADAMQVGKTKQRLYDTEYDHTGQKLSNRSLILSHINLSNTTREASAPSWYSVPGMSSPIDDERMRFNNSHYWSVNDVRKGGNDSEKRFTAHYLHTTERQSTSNITDYYLDGADPVTTTQTEYMHLSQDRISLDYNQNLNSEKAYGNEYLLIEGAQSDGLSYYNGTTTQRVKVPDIHVQNSFSRMFVYDKYQLQLSSDAEYTHSPQKRWIDNEREQLVNNLWYTNNSLKWLRKRVFSTASATVGFKAEHLNVLGGNTMLEVSARPYYQLKRGILSWVVSVPVAWQRFTTQNRSFLNMSPSVNIQIRQSNRTEWTVYSQFGQSTGSWSQFVLDGRRLNYRTTYYSNGLIPRNSTFSAGINYGYKRPVKEFFWSWRTSYSRSMASTMTDLVITDGQYRQELVERDSHVNSVNLRSDISKGIFDWNLKTRLGISYGYSNGQQSSAGRLTDYSSHSYTASPEIIYSPRWCDITYNGSFTLSKTSMEAIDMHSLLNWRQSLSLTKTINKVDITLSAVHYRNELQGAETKNTLLGDGTLTWRMKKIRLTATLYNLFNKREYVITSYSGVSSSTTYYQLRPREFVVKAQFSL